MPFTLLDFLFPRHSLLGSEGECVTRQEVALLRSSPVVMDAACLRRTGLQWIDRIAAAAVYDDVALLRSAVHTFKYRGVRGVGEALGTMLVGASLLLVSENFPVLCPVPLHWTRKFSRGFNQAEVLAQAVARERGWPAIALLRRTRPTGHQARRSRAERFAGVRDAFAVRRLTVPPYVVLVDDLSTTGATMDMCAKALKNAGAIRVEGLAVAMG